jgi:serine/threonine protein kinase
MQWLMGKACPALVPYLGARAKADGGLVLYMQLHTGKTLARFRQDCMDACTEPVLLSGFSTKGKNGIAYGSFHCKPGALPWDLKQQLARVLMQAMAQLQAAQLVHRDIKPLNIMLQGQEGAGGYEVQVSRDTSFPVNDSIRVLGTVDHFRHWLTGAS